MVISPIVLGLLFYALISPVALILRMFGRDELQLNKGVSSKSSYWREPINKIYSENFFKRQF